MNFNKDKIEEIFEKYNISSKTKILNQMLLKNLDKLNLKELKIILTELKANINGKKEQLIERIKEYNKNYKIIKLLIFFTSTIIFLKKDKIHYYLKKLAKYMTEKTVNSLIKIFFNEKYFTKIKYFLTSIFKSDKNVNNFLNFLEQMQLNIPDFHEVISEIDKKLNKENISLLEKKNILKKLVPILKKSNWDFFKILENISKDDELKIIIPQIFKN